MSIPSKLKQYSIIPGGVKTVTKIQKQIILHHPNSFTVELPTPNFFNWFL